jgi:hypothetical protein
MIKGAVPAAVAARHAVNYIETMIKSREREEGEKRAREGSVPTANVMGVEQLVEVGSVAAAHGTEAHAYRPRHTADRQR